MSSLAGPGVLSRGEASRWVGHIVTFAGWAVGSYLVTMLLWVLVPTVFLGWSPLVVVSDSMSPAIRAGDVVLVQSHSESVTPGTVIAFDVGQDVVIHRVVTATTDGVYETKGDANQRSDSTPVSAEQVIGQGRLLVPYLGLARVAGWGWWVGLVLLAAVAVPAWRLGTGAAAGLALALLVVAGAGVAWAVFSTTTASSGSEITAAEAHTPSGFVAQCGLIGVGSVQVDLSWSQSPSSGLTGYRILHDAPGGGVNYMEVGTVGPSQTTFTHTINVALLGLGTHTYVVQSLVGSWGSDISAPDSVTIAQVFGLYVCT